MLRGLSSMALAVLVLGACGSDDQPRLSGYGYGCHANAECAAHLTCRYQRCRQVCETPQDCEVGVCLHDAEHPNGVCIIKDEQACSDENLCAVGLACATDTICRPECQSGDDCASGDACTAGACTPP